MAEVTLSHVVNAPLADVWASWDDFGNIYRFHPALKGSHILEGSAPTGIGARRQCDLADGRNHLREEIVEYVEERRIAIEIYEASLPIKSARATVSFSRVNAERTEVRIRMAFKPAYGLLGVLMTPLMTLRFRSMLIGLLEANAAYVEKNGPAALAA